MRDTRTVSILPGVCMRIVGASTVVALPAPGHDEPNVCLCARAGSTTRACRSTASPTAATPGNTRRTSYGTKHWRSSGACVSTYASGDLHGMGASVQGVREVCIYPRVAWGVANCRYRALLHMCGERHGRSCHVIASKLTRAAHAVSKAMLFRDSAMGPACAARQRTPA